MDSVPDSRRALRLRSVVEEYASVALAACLVCLLLGAGLLYVSAVAPGTHAERVTVAAWDGTGEFTHRATVTRENPIYATGLVLSNRSVYYTSVSPVVNGSYVYSYETGGAGNATNATGNATGNLTVTVQVRRVLHAVDEKSDAVYWQTRESIETTERTGVEPGDAVRVGFATNTSALRAQIARIRQQVGRTPGESTFDVTAVVTVSGTVDGHRVAQRRTDTLSLAFDDRVVAVDDPGALTQRHAAEERVTVPNSYGPAWIGAGVILVVASSLGAAALLILRSRGQIALSGAERSRLRHLEERDELDEWISSATLPASAGRGTRIQMDSLSDLVDVAIDTDNRVLADESRDEYVVLGGDATYVYRAPAGTGYDDGAESEVDR